MSDDLGPHTAATPDTASAPSGRNRNKGLRMAAIAAAVVVLIGTAAAFAVPAIVRAANPKAYVAAAMAKTFDHTGFSGASSLAADLQKGAFEQALFLRLGDQYPAALGQLGQESLSIAPDRLGGTGLSLTLQSDAAQRKAALSLGVDLGLYHAGDLQIFADNNLLSFGSPELTDRKFYCVNTETLGADWAASPVFGQQEWVDPTLSFNFFDEIKAGETSSISSQTTARTTQLATDLNRAITVSKEESGIYLMTVPAQALRDYLTAVVQVLNENEVYRSTLAGSTDLPTDSADLVNAFQTDISVRFEMDSGMVARMVATTALTSQADAADVTLIMEFDKTEGLFCAVDIKSSDGEVISLSARLSASVDKAARQLSVDLPEFTILVENEPLVLVGGMSMKPMSDFSFSPQDPTPLLELDQNGLLSLLFQALSGLQTITQEMTT